MGEARRINEELLTDEFQKKLNDKMDKNSPIDWEQITNKPQLADNSWRSPVATVSDLPLTGNNDGDIRMVLDTNEVYAWKQYPPGEGIEGIWGLIGANDTNIEWNHIQGKPLKYPPESHTHTESEITDLIKDWAEITNKPTAYPPSEHNHDQYQLKGDYANKAHTHAESNITDLDKYSKAEVDTKLANKSTVGHKHTENDIADLDKYTKQEVDTKLAGKSDNAHNHDGRYYQKGEVDTKLNGKSDKAHTHPSYEASINDHETRLFNIEGGYSEGHTHDNLSTLKKIAYTGINTSIDLKGIEDNSISLGNKSDKGHRHTQADIVDLDPNVKWENVQNKPTQYPPATHSHTEAEITNLDKYTKQETDNKLAGKSDTNHNHDGRYPTKTELTNGLAGKSNTGHVHAISDVMNLQNALNNAGTKITVSTTQPPSGFWYKVIG